MLNGLKILVGILFGPPAVFIFIELIWSSMSFRTVGEINVVYSFQGQNRKNEFFCFNSASVYFFSNTCKKVIKWLEICLALVINSISTRRLEVDSSDLFFMFFIPFMVCHTSFSFFVTSKDLFLIRFFCLPK